jgi:xanthine dehydrogenase accessory factor
MRDNRPYAHLDQTRSLAVVLGTNEIASAVAVYLDAAGYHVVLSHDPFPPVIRRGMAFHDAAFGDEAIVEMIEGERADTATEIVRVLRKPARVAVTPLHLTDLIASFSPRLLVDARMQKHRVTPDHRNVVPLTIGLGPNFEIGVNCDIAVETRPAMNGTVLTRGRTDAADGRTQSLGRLGAERLVYTDRAGHWHTRIEIGMRAFKGFVLGHLDGMPVCSPIDGVVRGIARDSTTVPSGVKLIEIDPRGRRASWTGIDERGRAIAEATLRAIRIRQSQRAMLEAVSGPYLM